MHSLDFSLAIKFQGLALRFRLAYERRRNRARGWKNVPGLSSILRRPYSFEAPLIAQRLLNPSERYTLVDVGANNGSWGRRFLSLIPAGYVGFEPDPRAFAELARVQPTGKLHNVCVGGEVDTVQLELANVSTYSSKYRYDSRIEKVEVAKSIQVSQVRLDDVDLGPAPYILKIDVQGAEFEVLAGAKQTLAKTALLIMEVPLFGHSDRTNSISNIIGSGLSADFYPSYFCHPGISSSANSIPFEYDVLFGNRRLIDPFASLV